MTNNDTNQVRSVSEITEDDLTYEELSNLKNIQDSGGVISCRIIYFKDMDYETLEEIFQYSPDNLGLLLEHRPDFIKQYHPKVLN